jgi:hypothetical protein
VNQITVTASDLQTQHIESQRYITRHFNEHGSMLSQILQSHHSTRSEPTQALSIRRHPDKYRFASMRGSEGVRAGHAQLRLSDPAENCGGVVANFPARGLKLQRNHYEERLQLCGKEGEKRRKGLSNPLGYERSGKETRVLLSVQASGGL